MSATDVLSRGARKVTTVAKHQTAQLLKDMVLILASLCLPRHMKRLTCLVALYRHLVDAHVLRPASLQELNERFDLATDEQALLFPERYYRRIWDPAAIQSTLNGLEHTIAVGAIQDDEAQLREFCKRIAEVAPPSLSYGSLDALIRDIQSLVVKLGQKPIAAA